MESHTSTMTKVITTRWMARSFRMRCRFTELLLVGACFFGKPITHAAHGQDARRAGRIRLDFLPELADVDIDHPLDHHSLALG